MSKNQTKNKANGRQRASSGNRPQKVNKPKNNKQSTRALGANSTSVAAAYSSPVKSNQPKINYGKNGKSCRVQHKEFITNVSGTTNFTVALFLALNPGLATTFPWLSNIANNFEQYKVHMMRFCYLTRTGTNIPGSVIIAPDYDAADVAPVSEMILSNYAEVVEDAPWKDLCCVLRPSGMHAVGPKKFVRSGAVPGQDLKTTDVGSIILATVDGSAVNWGKFWVEYDVEFFEPQLNPIGSGLLSVEAIASQAATTGALPIGTGPLISQVGPAAFSYNSVTGACTCLVAGDYTVFFGIIGTVISAISQTLGNVSGNALSTLVINDFDGSATHGESFYRKRMSIGDYFTPTCTATTITYGYLVINSSNYDIVGDV